MVVTECQSTKSLLKISDDSDNLSAWLLKRKSGSKKNSFFSSTNRRFFTLDFGSQILFYKHSESEKKVSEPISFRSIISIQPLHYVTVADVVDDEADTQGDPQMKIERSSSKTSLASSLRKRMPSFIGTPQSLRAPKEQHGFVVETLDRSWELLCSSKMEADQWIAALGQAMRLGCPKSEELGRSDISSALCESSPPTPACSFDSSLANANCSEVSSKQSPPSSPALSDSPMPQHSINLVKEYEKAPWPESTACTSAALPPKVPKRPTVAKAKVPVTPLSPVDRNEVTVENKEVIRPSQNFNAAPMDDVRNASDGVTSYSEADARLEFDNEAWGVAQPPKISKIIPQYYDKAEGLSWQQRLEQLDFSDDEEDVCENDEAQQTSPVRNTSNLTAVAAATTSQPVAVEYCQPFTADLSDSDDE